MPAPRFAPNVSSRSASASDLSASASDLCVAKKTDFFLRTTICATKTMLHRVQSTLFRPGFVVVLMLSGCGPTEGPVLFDDDIPDRNRDHSYAEVDRLLDENLARLVAYADSLESALRPVPLLTNPQIQAFARYRNADQLRVARGLGIPQPVTAASIEAALQDGRLVELEPENRYWVIRDLEYSAPLVIPSVRILVEDIGRRFQARIAEYGLPPLRLEITSVLRTAEDQARLRRVNPNAAISESTHQFGTTIDIAYSSFRAPLEPGVDLDTGEERWLEPHLRRVEAMAAETGAARMSRELQAILGHVLREMQAEGMVMVTMEVRQPVYHMTVARRLVSGD